MHIGSEKTAKVVNEYGDTHITTGQNDAPEYDDHGEEKIIHHVTFLEKQRRHQPSLQALRQLNDNKNDQRDSDDESEEAPVFLHDIQHNSFWQDPDVNVAGVMIIALVVYNTGCTIL